MAHPRKTLGLEQAMRLTDLLMGAAHADGSMDGTEGEVIERLLAQRLGTPILPRTLRQRIERFDPTGFDPAAVAVGLALETAEDRRALLALIGQVVDADDVHHMREDEYIRRVADAIEASDDERAGLTVDVLWDLSLVPPPMPAD